MSNAPAHAAEHDQLMQLLAKATRNSELIAAIVLITIGVDGRPCVGSDMDSPAMIHKALREIGEAEDQIADVSQVRVPKDN